LGMPGRDVSGLGRVGKRKRGEPRLARTSSLAASSDYAVKPSVRQAYLYNPYWAAPRSRWRHSCS
jgi:hypothetical protein